MPRFHSAILFWLTLAARALSQENIDDLLQQATQASQVGDRATSIARLNEALQKSPTTALPWYLRGREHFRAGQIKESVADFDRYVQISPQVESQLWERGIAYYYLGDYGKGAKQFADYQKFHDQDVENSAWRYLCVAKDQGVEKARQDLLPIKSDTRVPMMQIYSLYQSQTKPDDVLAAAGNDNQALFYAHLYVGLWHEVAGRQAEAKKHIFAAREHRIAHYMWDVARVHAERLEAAEK